MAIRIIVKEGEDVPVSYTHLPDPFLLFEKKGGNESILPSRDQARTIHILARRMCEAPLRFSGAGLFALEGN